MKTNKNLRRSPEKLDEKIKLYPNTGEGNRELLLSMASIIETIVAWQKENV